MEINPNGVRIENIFLKHKPSPSNNKNMPTYIGFLVLEKTPSVIICDDFSIARVVLYLLNRVCVLPINTKPAKAINIPAKLHGNGTRLYVGNKK